MNNNKKKGMKNMCFGMSNWLDYLKPVNYCSNVPPTRLDGQHFHMFKEICSKPTYFRTLLCSQTRSWTYSGHPKLRSRLSSKPEHSAYHSEALLTELYGRHCQTRAISKPTETITFFSSLAAHGVTRHLEI